MKITAITTCLNFDDYLRICVAQNAQHFDEWIVITGPDDPCLSIEGVTFHITDEFHRKDRKGNPAPFNKGAAINDCLSNYKHQLEWIVLLDSDIILPKDFGPKIRTFPLDQNKIYGMYRNDCLGSLDEYLAGDESGLTPKHGNQHRDLGVGAFALFHWTAETMCNRREKGTALYPVQFPTATRSDRFNLKGWIKAHRGDHNKEWGIKSRSSAIAVPLPEELFGRLVHYGTDCVRSRENHEGRTTERIQTDYEKHAANVPESAVGCIKVKEAGEYDEIDETTSEDDYCEKCGHIWFGVKGEHSGLCDDCKDDATTQGVLYLLNWGCGFLTRLAVSLFSLRQHYNGPVTVLGSTGGEVDFEMLERICDDFHADLVRFETPGKGRVNSLPIKARLHELTPYDRTLYLDADTVVMQPIDELFEAIKEYRLIAVQQSDWRCGGKIAGRLTPYIEAGILSKPPDDFPAINTGVFGFERTHEVFDVWHDKVMEAIEKKSKDHCLDESVLNLLMAMNADKDYGYILPPGFNASVTKHKEPFDEAAIIHYHGGKHWRKDWMIEKPDDFGNLTRREQRRFVADATIPEGAWDDLRRGSQIWCETFDAMVAKHPYYLKAPTDRESQAYVEWQHSAQRVGQDESDSSSRDRSSGIAPVMTPATSCPIPKTRLSPTDEELAWLRDIARKYDGRQILEFGCGPTTWALMAPYVCDHLCIETNPHDVAPDDEKWCALYDAVVDHCNPDIQDNWDFAERTFDFVLVDSSAGGPWKDGLHRHDALKACEQHLTQGAIVVAHDAFKRSGKAVVAYCEGSNDYTKIAEFKGRTGLMAWRFARKEDVQVGSEAWTDYSDITLVMVVSDAGYLDKAELTLQSFDKLKGWHERGGKSLLVEAGGAPHWTFEVGGSKTFQETIYVGTNGATQRERSLAAHIFASRHVTTPWMLKLDAAIYAVDDKPFLLEDFRDYDLIARPCSYTKGAQMVPMLDYFMQGTIAATHAATLQLSDDCKRDKDDNPRFFLNRLPERKVTENDWAQIEPLLTAKAQTFVMDDAGKWSVHPFRGVEKNYDFTVRHDNHSDLWALKMGHSRIQSQVRLAKTSLLREIADLCPHDRLPAPSEDTTLWRYCERMQRPWLRHDFYKHGGLAHNKRIVKVAKSNPEYF